MKSYILKPKSVKINQIREKEFSLSSFSFNFINYKNQNIKILSEICIENKKGFEPGSSEYIEFLENYFIRISEMSDLNFTFGVNNDTKKIKPVKGKNIINKGDLCYQTASNVGNVCFYNGPKAYYNSHIRKLNFENNFYIFSLLKSNFCKEQVSVGGSIKGVDNFRSDLLENIKIPFPSKNNNENPKNIEKLVSLITQNIINKEEQIKLKNDKIDLLIEKELLENQKINNYNYSFPRISEIKNETRLDTGLYEKDYKKLTSLIENYKNGFYLFGSKILKFNSGSTPKVYLEFDKGSLIWISNKDFRKNIWNNFRKIKTTKENYKNLIPKNSIIFSRRAPAGISQFIPEKINAIGNDGIKTIITSLNFIENCFISLFINSVNGQKLLSELGGGGTFDGMTNDDIIKIKIPNFPELKQQEIAKEYYNKIDKNIDLTLDNYLEKEFGRNSKLGIFQLNMELFNLKEQLEDIIDKIIMDEKIDIDLNY